MHTPWRLRKKTHREYGIRGIKRTPAEFRIGTLHFSFFFCRTKIPKPDRFMFAHSSSIDLWSQNGIRSIDSLNQTIENRFKFIYANTQNSSLPLHSIIHTLIRYIIVNHFCDTEVPAKYTHKHRVLR